MREHYGRSTVYHIHVILENLLFFISCGSHPFFRELDISEPPLYTSEGIRDIAGLEAVDRTALYALLARILDGSRFFEFKVPVLLVFILVPD